jgi:DNA primase
MTTDEIKQSVSMLEVVERYGLRPNRAGFISCPFHHGDRTPSMKIYKRDYHCHACGANGDIFSFVMGMERCDFKTAYKALGGSYKQQSDHQRNLYHYHLQKRKEMEIKRLQRAEQEKKEVIEEIRMQKLFKMLSPVFSDDWCDAVNRLEFLFYRLDTLIKEKR